MSKESIVAGDFGLVWQAAERWVAPGISTAIRAGLSGKVARRSGVVLIASDLIYLLMPGLAALGVEAKLHPFQGNANHLISAADEETEVCLLAFDGALELLPPEEIDDATPPPENSDPIILSHARLIKADDGRTYWHDGAGQMTSDLPEIFRGHFGYALTLDRANVKTSPRSIIAQEALCRWLEHSAAYPERAQREAEISDDSSLLAAAFLQETIKNRRDFASNRLRYAAQYFEAGQAIRAYDWLRQAVLAKWSLPAVADALLTPSSQHLSESVLRELVYLARAGTSTLKILAARRLTHEHHPDVLKTLHQLRFDQHPWVRAAARPLT